MAQDELQTQQIERSEGKHVRGRLQVLDCITTMLVSTLSVLL